VRNLVKLSMKAYLATIVALIVVPIAANQAAAVQPQAPQPPPTGSPTRQSQIFDGEKMAFDVASVKPNKLRAQSSSNVPLGPGDDYSPTGGLFSAKDTPLLVYIMFAYKITSLGDLRSFPNWVANNNYDIQARAQGNPTKGQMRLMMQSLLADRFKLALHTESQTKPIYALVLSKPGRTGPQLQPYVDDGTCSPTTNPSAPLPQPATPSASTSAMQLPPMPCGDFSVLAPSAPGRFRVGGKNVPMALIARQLPSGALAGVDRPVFDGTGLSGNFDFSIEWTPRLPGTAPPDEAESTFIEALKDQLGLKLDSRSGPVDILVIDHIEEPSEN
jgi:uncharacterized protein (TIGR03435 family)